MDCDAIIELLIGHGYILSDDKERATILLREAFPDEGRKNHPVLNPEVLVADIRAEGSPGKGRWKIGRAHV